MVILNNKDYERLKALIGEAQRIVDSGEAYTPDIKEPYFFDEKSVWELDLPRNVEIRVLCACKDNGIDTIGGLLKQSPKRFMRNRKIGKGCIEAIQKRLKEKYNVEWT